MAAMAIGAVWTRPRPLDVALRPVVVAYNPSDVPAGALVGVVGALIVTGGLEATQ
jgi:hypothetical protein